MRRLLSTLSASLLLASGLGCSTFGPGQGLGSDGLVDSDPYGDDGSGADDDDDAAVQTLHCEVEPAALTMQGDSVVSAQLSVSRIASDGTLEPAADVQWFVLDDFGGTVDATGRYTPSPTHGGRVDIEANSAGLQGICTLEVYLELEAIEPSAEVVEPAILDLSPEISDDCGPDLMYPLEGSVLARDLGPPTLQWIVPVDLNVFVITIENAFTSLKVLTLEESWTPNASQWAALTHSAGGEEFSISVAGGLVDSVSWDLVTGLCRDASPIAGGVYQFGVAGTVYYWSPATSGLWSIGVGAPGAQAWLDNESTGHCVGCHTVNLSNSDRMAMVYGGGNGWAVAVDVASPESPVLAPEDRPGNFTALSPDGTRLIRSYEGQLHLENLLTNATIGTLPVTGHATHVDWAPDGTRIVYSSCTDSNDHYDWQVWGCEIRSVDVLAGDQFGPETVLVAADPDWNYYYPTVSPDGNWVAFNRHAGGDSERTSYANTEAQLMLVSLWEGEPILLSNASQPGQTNSWPRWGPTEGDFAWLTFSSKRSYGTTSHNVSQIWLSAINFNDAVQGLDASSAPIWLPSQDSSTGNHRPVWVPRY